MADAKMICYRTCYLHNKRWEVGEEFIAPFPGAQPNRHFSPGGVPPKDEAVRSVHGPGDDPRSTKEMRESLEAAGVKVSKGWGRKTLFAKLMEIESPGSIKKPESGQPPLVDPNNTGPAYSPARGFDNLVLNKRFGEMSPDDIDGLKADEIRAKLEKPPYSINLGSGYVKKETMIERGIAIEEQMVRSKQQ